ncbi:MAG TPA: alpha/beta hydrolase [Candidatus Binatia bacterium]|nr:alpha/beta hydrolase [Candidatus Binatia bacterium]
MVFTHGNMGFGQQFFLQTRIFRRQYRCIVHDLRGCGLSGKPQAETYDTNIHSSDLHTILHALNVKRAVHIGHSFGGPISLQYYFDYPGEVAGIVFLGSYAAGTQLAISEEQVLQFYETIQGRQQVFETFVTHEKFTKYNPYGANIAALLKQEAGKPPIYASKAICRGFFRLDFTQRLSAVEVPALVIHGDTDKPVPFETSGKVLAGKIPDAGLAMIKDTGHFPHMEKPELVNEAVWQWLEEKIAPGESVG